MLYLKNVSKESSEKFSLLLCGSVRSMVMNYETRTNSFRTNSRLKGGTRLIDSENVIRPSDVNRSCMPAYTFDMLLDEILGNSLEQNLSTLQYMELSRFDNYSLKSGYKSKFLFAPLALYQLWPLSSDAAIVPRSYSMDLLAVGVIANYSVDERYGQPNFSKARLKFEFHDARGSDDFMENVESSLLTKENITVKPDGTI